MEVVEVLLIWTPSSPSFPHTLLLTSEVETNCTSFELGMAWGACLKIEYRGLLKLLSLIHKSYSFLWGLCSTHLECSLWEHKWHAGRCPSLPDRQCASTLAPVTVSWQLHPQPLSENCLGELSQSRKQPERIINGCFKPLWFGVGGSMLYSNR